MGGMPLSSSAVVKARQLLCMDEITWPDAQPAVISCELHPNRQRYRDKASGSPSVQGSRYGQVSL